jgi:hypothetical protein
MKTATTIKAIKDRYNGKIYKCGYCDLQLIFKGIEPDFYNSGVYGWNCDIYVIGGVAITTGYRNTTGKKIPHEMIAKYDVKAVKSPDDLINIRYDFISDLKTL